MTLTSPTLLSDAYASVWPARMPPVFCELRPLPSWWMILGCLCWTRTSQTQSLWDRFCRVRSSPLSLFFKFELVRKDCFCCDILTQFPPKLILFFSSLNISVYPYLLCQRTWSCVSLDWDGIPQCAGLRWC